MDQANSSNYLAGGNGGHPLPNGNVPTANPTGPGPVAVAVHQLMPQAGVYLQQIQQQQQPAFSSQPMQQQVEQPLLQNQPPPPQQVEAQPPFVPGPFYTLQQQQAFEQARLAAAGKSLKQNSLFNQAKIDASASTHLHMSSITTGSQATSSFLSSSPDMSEQTQARITATSVLTNRHLFPFSSNQLLAVDRAMRELASEIISTQNMMRSANPSNAVKRPAYIADSDASSASQAATKRHDGYFYAHTHRQDIEPNKRPRYETKWSWQERALSSDSADNIELVKAIDNAEPVRVMTSREYDSIEASCRSSLPTKKKKKRDDTRPSSSRPCCKHEDILSMCNLANLVHSTQHHYLSARGLNSLISTRSWYELTDNDGNIDDDNRSDGESTDGESDGETSDSGTSTAASSAGSSSISDDASRKKLVMFKDQMFEMRRDMSVDQSPQEQSESDDKSWESDGPIMAVG